MRRYLSLFLVVFICGVVKAQTVKGKLLDGGDSKPLAGATLKLSLAKDSTTSFNAVSDSKGDFQFNNLPKGSFNLLVSFIGYENFKQSVVLTDSLPNVDMGSLMIPKATKELAGVTVVGKGSPAVQKGDTTQYSASQFKTNPDATVEDLVKKMPGITVGRDGTVTAQGEQVRKVTIDGRDFFGDDASAALKNLPADVVDKIQVFDRLSDQAQFTGVDDGNSQRSINVVTKSGMRNGQFGRIYAGAGTDSRYSAGGNVSFFKENRRISFVGLTNNINQQNFASQDLLGVTSSGGSGGMNGGGMMGGGGRDGGGGGGNFGGGGNNFSVGQQSGISKTNAFGINYSDKWGKKVDVSGSYFFNNSTNDNDKISSKQTPILGKIRYEDQTSFSISKNTNHRINLRLEYKIDSSNSIIISPSLSFQKNNSLSESMTRTLSNTDTVNTSDGNSRSFRDGYNVRNNILYRHNFAKRGRSFSVNLNTSFSKNDGESYIVSHNRSIKQSVVTDIFQDQYSSNPTNGYNLSANFNYNEPLTDKAQLQFNYSPSISKNKANQETFLFDPVESKYSEFVDSLSNKFENTTTTNNGGITYRYTPNRDDQFSISVNYQHSRLESERIFPTASQVNQTFSNIIPNIQWRKKLSAKSNVRFFYRGNTNFPSVTQLQDVIDNRSVLSVSSGNPNLKQSYTHFVSGRYVYTNSQKGQSFFLNLAFQTAKDYIANAVYIPDQDSVIQNVKVLLGSQFSKPINLNGYRNFRSFLTYGLPVKALKSTVNLNAGFTYSRLPGLNDYNATITNNLVYTGGVVVASNVSEYVDFNISYNASINDAKTKSNLPSVESKMVSQSLGVQANLLSKNGWFLQNDISNQHYSYSGDDPSTNFTLWNAGIGKKFLKNRAGELKLSVFDLLKQNQSVFRNVGDGGVIEDSRSKVLQQYFMLTFTYNLKNFGKPAARNNNGGERRWDGGNVPRF